MRILILSLIFAISCSTEPAFEDPFANLPPNQLEVVDVEGVVRFWDYNDYNKFYIVVYVKGTIDSAVLGFVDDLDESFKQEGLSVIFSGTYEKSDSNPTTRIGGQDIYSLSLTAIRAI